MLWMQAVDKPVRVHWRHRDHGPEASELSSPSKCVVANRISFEVCGTGDRLDGGAGAVEGMRERAPW